LPTWDDLRTQVLDLCKTHRDVLHISETVASRLVEKLSNDSDGKTLDKIAEEMSTDADYSAFQKLTAYALLLGEKSSDNNEGWIEVLTKSLANYLRDTSKSTDAASYTNRNKNLNRLCFVSLNYDRIFMNRFMRNIANDFANLITDRKLNRLRKWPQPNLNAELLQLHGAIGSLETQHRSVPTAEGVDLFHYHSQPLLLNHSALSPYEDTSLTIPFGDTTVFEKTCSHHGSDADIKLNLIAADDLNDAEDLRNYHRANSRFKNSHIICIGLSPMGFNQSKLSFVQAKSVTFTNTENEIIQFDKARLPNKDLYYVQQGIYAKPLLEKISAP